ncbi:hypothetical protein CFS9_37410 [Flavobacterium sp. CFS9]|uniref:Uncharacterized protein n=2 Tax=Flavobacteriaceae TaxID=49546 RepID=A0AAT9H6M7_9FLAO
MAGNLPPKKKEISAMEKTIRLKVRKDLDAQQQSGVIKLKGTLISKGYTQIIHILDLNEEFHVNTFETPSEKTAEAMQYIAAFISAEKLLDAVMTD